MKKNFLVAVLSVFAISLFFTGNVSALTPTNLPKNRPSQSLNRKPSIIPNLTSRAAANKLKSCQARENAIKIRLEKLIQLTKTMELKFDSILTRVKDYYN